MLGSKLDLEIFTFANTSKPLRSNLGVFLAQKKFSLEILIKSPPVYAIIISVFF